MKVALMLLLSSFYGINSSLAYNIDQSKISVSGISSGSYMAGQLHVALSGTFSGVGLVAGGPYYCSQGSV
ncbi:MAG: polyhydroxybutyrate depolymerase, partial [Bdellovibrionaceae bacterium]|nr:polyhydroxybutyrate depolymerase [Pseudobdellovibrionaceae bacterium]